MIAPTLTTARLTLRAYRLEDFDKLAAIYHTERSRYIGGPLPAHMVWLGFMNGIGQWPILGLGTWAVDLTATGACIGEVGVTRPVDYPETELGWLLFDGYEGQGYAFEAAQVARAYAFETVRSPSLVSYVDPDNEPSIRLAQRLGGERDPTAPTPHGAPTLVFRYPIPALRSV